MEGCFLQPPNNELLSNDVIGTVMQRSKPSRLSRPTYQNDDSSPQNRFYDTDECEMAETSAKRRGRPSRPQSKSISSLSYIKRSDFKEKLTTDNDQARVMAEILFEEKLRIREMRRVRQLRYRKKKESYTVDLDNENRQLRGEIKQLQQRHRSASTTIPAKESAWNVVVEYFRLFRFGLSELLVTAKPTSPPELQQSAQMDFLLASMTSDVLFNNERGIDAIMKSWCFMSSCFASVEMELDGLAKNALGSIIATTTTTVTFSKHTVDSLFPHLARIDRNKREILSWTEKFVNEKIVMRGSTYFEWDAGYCRIASIQHQSDMITPMLRVLGTLESVSRAFDKALITPDFRCRQKTKPNP